MVLNRHLKIYSNINKEKEIQEETLTKQEPESNIFRFYSKCDFDNFDRNELKKYNWKIAHALTSKQKDILRTFSGYKENKETVKYCGPQGNAIMHRNYETDIHKLIINPNKLKDYEDSIKAIKSMFELELGVVCYNEDNLPEELAIKIKKAKESKLINKLELSKPN